MARKTKRHPRIGERDWLIFHHIHRYRLTTPEVLHRLFFPECQKNAVSKATSRLVEGGFLNRWPFLNKRVYFTVGPAACKVLGISPRKAKKLGPQALTTEFGTLAFCFNVDPPRERLLVSEIQAKDKKLLGKGLSSGHYYIDENESIRRLAMIRVEQGSTPDLIVKKCARELEKRQRHDAHASMIDQGLFMFAIVTSTEQKKQQIHLRLRRTEWPVSFRIETVPELIQLNAKSRS